MKCYFVGEGNVPGKARLESVLIKDKFLLILNIGYPIFSSVVFLIC